MRAEKLFILFSFQVATAAFMFQRPVFLYQCFMETKNNDIGLRLVNFFHNDFSKHEVQ